MPNKGSRAWIHFLKSLFRLVKGTKAGVCLEEASLVFRSPLFFPRASCCSPMTSLQFCCQPWEIAIHWCLCRICWCLFCTRLLSWDAGGSKVLFSWVFFPVPVRQGRVPSYSARISTSARSSVQAFFIRNILASLATCCFCLMPCSGWRLLTAATGFPILPLWGI